MNMGKFNEPSHSDIASTCEIFKSSDAANLGTILLALFCFHTHFPLLFFAISISLVAFIFHSHFVLGSIYFSQSLCAFNSCNQTFLLMVCGILKCSFSNLY